jgi:predicted nucleic acid-binding protein
LVEANKPTLVDTGPLVAILNQKDGAHEQCKSIFAGFKSPLITCWPVLTEAVYLLNHNVQAIRMLFSFFDNGILVFAQLGMPSMWFPDFIAKYDNAKPDLADAALVYLAERDSIETIFTLDHTDFSIYRTAKKRALIVIPATSM